MDITSSNIGASIITNKVIEDEEIDRLDKLKRERDKKNMFELLADLDKHGDQVSLK